MHSCLRTSGSYVCIRTWNSGFLKGVPSPRKENMGRICIQYGWKWPAGMYGNEGNVSVTYTRNTHGVSWNIRKVLGNRQQRSHLNVFPGSKNKWTQMNSLWKTKTKQNHIVSATFILIFSYCSHLSQYLAQCELNWRKVGFSLTDWFEKKTLGLVFHEIMFLRITNTGHKLD